MQNDKTCLDRRKRYRSKHPEKIKAARTRYKKAHPEKIKAYRSRYKKAHPDQNRKWRRASYAKARYEAIYHYSNGTLKCAVCGDRHYEFLEIDHINGGGKEHKRKINSTIFQWVRQNNYPDGYQVLCSNCNNKKVKTDAKQRSETGTAEQRKYYNRSHRERLAALQHYSPGIPHCDCCGELDMDVLCLDHKNNDRADHRKSLKKHEGDNIARWARKAGYPDIFRVLCHNCNQSLGKYGYCPHKIGSRYDMRLNPEE
jgi:hypothetical protein